MSAGLPPVSVQQRLFSWLAGSIVVAGILAGSLSFWLSYLEANELQDAQLAQVADVLAAQAPVLVDKPFKPRNGEDAETHFVIKRLGMGGVVADPLTDLSLPDTLSAGLQTVERAGVQWRVLVAQDLHGQRFGVAQRMTVRDEDAQQAALLTAIPLALLVPVLLLIVSLVLRQSFEPMRAMSRHVDQLDGTVLTPLDEGPVPKEALPFVQAVNRMMMRLSRSLEQQRRLVSDAAHELRTPVAALTVQAANVMHVELSLEAASRMGLLRQGLSRMSSLLEQLLDFARVQGYVQSTPCQVHLDETVRAVIEELWPTAEAKSVDLGCVCLARVSVVAEPMHLSAIVRNAISNAVKYTPAGGTVDVSVFQEGAMAHLVVEDTGPGIHPADLERVFDPFVRLLGSQEQGSGLGLAIARTAAAALGGRIVLCNREDVPKGLRFAYSQPV